jgi:hypothetical protein
LYDRWRGGGKGGCKGLELGDDMWITPDFEGQRKLKFAMLNPIDMIFIKSSGRG